MLAEITQGTGLVSDTIIIMSGDASIRGFLIQAHICLMDALDGGWVTVNFDHQSEHHLVDIRWHLPDGTDRIVQVKANQSFSRDEIDQFTTEFEKIPASKRELVLVARGAKFSKMRFRKSSGVDIRKVSLEELNSDDFIGKGLAKLRETLGRKDQELLTLFDAFRYFSEGTIRLFESSHCRKSFSRLELLDVLRTSFAEASELAVKRELREIDQFVQLFGFEPDRPLRRPIIQLFELERALDRRKIKRLNQFFRVREGWLVVDLDKPQWIDLGVSLFCLAVSFLALIIVGNSVTSTRTLCFVVPILMAAVVGTSYWSGDYLFALQWRRRIRQKI